jgi:hypothetical protein
VTWQLLAPAVLVLACAGCSDAGGKLYSVSGKVTYKGEPATGAFVFLIRKGVDPLDEQSIMGVVQEDGSFTVVCDVKGQGAPRGKYDVLIKWPQNAGPKKGLAHKNPDRLKGRYADPKRPRWSVEIRAEPNELPEFELAD